MEQFVEYDPEYGEDPLEYEAMCAAECGLDLAPDLSKTRAKVKLLTTSLKWICAAKPKQRTLSLDSGTTRYYFSQCLFTVRGNRVILTYDAGRSPLADGPGRGQIVEIFGRTIDEETNPDKTRTAFISGAEVMKTGRREMTAKTVSPPAPPAKPRPDAAARMRARVATEIRTSIQNLKRELEWDDTREDELKERIVDLTIRLARVERGEELAKPDAAAYAGPERRVEPRIVIVQDGAEAELRALVIDQLDHDNDSAGEVVDKDLADAEEDAETIDHDDDGAELSRATEPWADSSLPVGATLDPDCWDCPARLGSTCSRPSACLML